MFIAAITIGMAVVVLACAYGVLFVADYFFKVDFRFWVLTVRTFTPAVIIVLQYVTFISTGDVFYTGISNILGIRLFPVVVILLTMASSTLTQY